MAQKRKSTETIDLVSDEELPPPYGRAGQQKAASGSGGDKENDRAKPAPAAKKQKVAAVAPKEDTRPLLERILAVELEDETVYDNCDQVRKKILEFTLNPNNGVTKKAFCEAIGNVNSNSLRTFQGYKGPTKGSGSCVYPGAYIFFEKLRILQGKPKTAFRKRAEAELPNGFSTAGGREYYWAPKGVTYRQNALGQLVPNN